MEGESSSNKTHGTEKERGIPDKWGSVITSASNEGESRCCVVVVRTLIAEERNALFTRRRRYHPLFLRWQLLLPNQHFRVG